MEISLKKYHTQNITLEITHLKYLAPNLESQISGSHDVGQASKKMRLDTEENNCQDV